MNCTWLVLCPPICTRSTLRWHRLRTLPIFGITELWNCCNTEKKDSSRNVCRAVSVDCHAYKIYSTYCRLKFTASNFLGSLISPNFQQFISGSGLSWVGFQHILRREFILKNRTVGRCGGENEMQTSPPCNMKACLYLETPSSGI